MAYAQNEVYGTILVFWKEEISRSEIVTMVTLLGEKFNFLCIFMLSVPLTFQNNVNYASTLNVWEGRKFYNLGNKSFETDFNYSYKIRQWIFLSVCSVQLK